MIFLRRFVALLAITSALSALIERWSQILFGVSSIEKLFTLSLQGIQNGYLWQFFTYPFIPFTNGLGITFNTLIQVAFPLIILWQIGRDLIDRIGKRNFLLIFFTSSALVGLITLLFSLLSPYSLPIGGAYAPVLTLLTLWCCFLRDAQIFLFFIFPVKADWIPKGILFFQFLSFLSTPDIQNLVFTFSAVGLGYIFDMFLNRFESFTDTGEVFFDKLKGFFRKIFKKKRKATILDFETGRPLSEDDLFLEEMLEKISKHGKESLTEKEKERLDKISRRKA